MQTSLPRCSAPRGLAAHDADGNGKLVIVIAPPEVSSCIDRTLDVDVVAFRSLDELDRWRKLRVIEAESPLHYVAAALEAIDVALDALPPSLRNALETASHYAAVPSPRVLEEQFPSRRSFYRLWATFIPEPPSRLLHRARGIHARRMLAAGAAAKAAAFSAGFSSPEQMRRYLALGDLTGPVSGRCSE